MPNDPHPAIPIVSLEELGWDDRLAASLRATQRPECVPARVAVVYQDRLRVLGERGPLWAELSGRLRHDSRGQPLARPAAGDWVALERNEGGGMATIHELLPRRTQLVRQAAGRRTAPQLLAANVDVIFVVTSCNQELNPRRVERYLTAVRDGGARPALVLNKSDLVGDPAPLRARLRELAGDAPVLTVSARARDGAAELAALLAPGRTVALVGSSGVGKSTIINWLIGHERQATGEIREADDKGRHTTTHRELIPLPRRALERAGGPALTIAGVLLDTPGIRELQPWTDESEDDAGIQETFAELDAIARRCRFGDCGHGREPGCAVRRAVKSGALAADRVASYRKLAQESRDRAERKRGRSRREHSSTGRAPRHSGRES
ncbi:MAG: ribosome small subunit-dependent GTPase A [Myxococcales bacterium]|nr:ribosome small subunit-dependent GTPase A [Myxococcales bacterium]